MPCCETESEKNWFANLPAQEHLEKMKIPVASNRYPNDKLCELCSKMTLTELKESSLEEWYLKHLFIDGEREPFRVLKEILRIYSK